MAITANNEEIYSRTEAEYREIDKKTAEYRHLFSELKALEEVGKYGSEVWMETFRKYAETFKSVNGYRPHWAH